MTWYLFTPVMLLSFLRLPPPSKRLVPNMLMEAGDVIVSPRHGLFFLTTEEDTDILCALTLYP